MPQNYICLNCKAVHNFEPKECPCCGRKTFHKTDALVTFDQPGSEADASAESQEELEDRVHITLSMNLPTLGRFLKAIKTDPEIWAEVKDELTRLTNEFETRKTP